LKDYLSWDKLRSIQTNRIVNSMYIWLVIVPVTAKIFSKIENEIILTLNGKEYILDLVLPFSWQMFFFSALFFVLGNLFYSMLSPKIIKEYRDFGHFLQVGGINQDLYDYKDDVLKEKSESRDKLRRLTGEELSFKKKESTNYDEKVQYTKDLFWEIYKYYNVKNLALILIPTFFYSIGFLLFLCVASSNVYWVFSQTTIF